jgi:hypothetical protein
MDENQLIEAIREPVARSELRNDFAHLFAAELSAPATTAAVDGAERAIGYALHPFHRRLLTEVGNGGFGPGYGLVGLPGGISDVDGRSLVELSRMLLLELSASPSFPVSFLCDWGCGVWGCIDCETGAVLTIAEDGLKDTARPSARGLKIGFPAPLFGEGSSKKSNGLCKTHRPNYLKTL